MAGRKAQWSGVDEAELVDAARRAPDAFAELYRQHAQRIHAFAYRRTWKPEIAEDIVSATFERAWRRLDSYDSRRGAFVNWLLGIAANEMADLGRRKERDERDRSIAATIALSSTQSEDPAESMPDDTHTRAVVAALDSLPPRYQEVLGLRYLEGLSPAETAGALDMAPSKLAVTTHRAKRALQRELDRRTLPDEELR